ncbi:MAG TPA: SWIM zinc finger family protein [Chloroflexota bacterium]|jgi:hypothetical protein
MITSPRTQDTTPEPQPLDLAAIPAGTFRAIVARGIEAHPELATTIERGLVVALTARISPAMSGQPDCFWVEASDRSKEYWVVLSEYGYRGDRCSCPSATHRGAPCKHAVGVRLALKAIERAGRGPTEPPPTPLAFPARTLADDAPIPFELTALAVAVLDGAAAEHEEAPRPQAVDVALPLFLGDPRKWTPGSRTYAPISYQHARYLFAGPRYCLPCGVQAQKLARWDGDLLHRCPQCGYTQEASYFPAGVA